MKVLMVLMCVALIQVRATTFAQMISLKKNVISYKGLFKEIKKQTGYDIIYAEKIIDDRLTVTLPYLNSTLDRLLSAALKGKKVNYVIDGKFIILSYQSEIISSPIPVEKVQLLEIKGKVTDEKNVPIPGVTVRAAVQTPADGKFRFLASVSTATDGTFTLKTSEPAKLLLFSYVGYENQMIQVDGRPYFSISMKASDNPLDVVQVIAYGSTTKRLTTGSVASLKAEDIEKQPISNPLMSLSGRMAGVLVTEGSGVVGSSVTMQIRGQNTIGGNRNPLYIVDGVPFSARATETAAGIYGVNTNLGTSGTLSPFDNIPTSDIESIDILKDADATAIYGSRAANGVVVITTKKGKAGSMRINANIYTGVGEITKGIDMLSTDEYLSVRKKAFANDNLVPSVTNAPDLITFGNGYTDYLDLIMGNSSKLTDATFDVSGGSQKTQYMVSANYRNQSSVFPSYFADNKATVRFNLQTRSDNNKFSLNFSGGYTKNKNNLPNANVTSIYALPPNLPIYNADDSFYWHNSYTNPLASLQAPSAIETDNVLANASVKYEFISGLNFKIDMGFNRLWQNQLNASTRASRNPSAATGSVTMQNNYTQTYTVEPQLNFSRTLGPGKLDVLLGGTYLENLAVQPLFLFGSFTNDALYRNISSITPQLMYSGYNRSKFLSTFGRVNYNINDKYILSLNGRRDGSSRFGPSAKFGSFGSVGAAWIFSEETFVKEAAPWLSFAKIRGSYGSVGTEPQGDYAYISTYAAIPFANSYDGVAALVASNLANDEYRWEVTKKLELSMDLNFFRDRIATSVSWYRNRSNNMLVSIPMPTQTGFTSFVGNLPALVQNRGWEFVLDSKNITVKNFSWSTSVNLTFPKTTLLAFPGLAGSTYADTYVVGQSLNVIQNYHFTGFENGIAQFQDVDGNGTISPGSYKTTGSGDYKVSGSTDPDFYGGLNNSLNYKGFQLDFLFSFAKKKGYNIYNNSAIPGTATNLIADVLNKPFAYTTLTAGPAAVAFNRYKTSDATFDDASYVRLKNVSFSYRFGDTFLKKVGVKGLNIYFRGQNLLTFSKYLGMDPETLGISIPPMKLYTIGFQTSL